MLEVTEILVNIKDKSMRYPREMLNHRFGLIGFEALEMFSCERSMQMRVDERVFRLFYAESFVDFLNSTFD